jgi:hypothetical protein
MSVALSIVGILVAGAGLATLGFGIPFKDLPFAPTLLVTGTTAFCGGLILIGLAAVVNELRRIAEGLRVKPGARPGRVSEDAAMAAPALAATGPIAPVRPPAPQVAAPPRPRPEARPAEVAQQPQAAPASAVDVSAVAIERLRSSIPRAERPEPTVVAEEEQVPLSPNGGGHPPAPSRGPVVEPPTPPRVTAEDRPASAAVETVKTSRLDFLFRSRSPRPLQPQSFDSTWPSEGRPAPARGRDEPRLDDRPPMPLQASSAPPTVAVDAEPRRAEPTAEASPSVAILKSGVVDGMAYTLYADGSIEAKLPHGTVRFGSIAELRAHIESNS